MISHRYNTVRDADCIYVLDRGRIIEHGSHDQLVSQAGSYAELFTLQAAAYADQPQAKGHRDTQRLADALAEPGARPADQIYST